MTKRNSNRISKEKTVKSIIILNQLSIFQEYHIINHQLTVNIFCLIPIPISDNCNCDNFTLKNKNVYYAIFDAEIFCQIPSIHSLLDLSNYPCAYCVFYVRCIAAAIEVTLLKYISWVHSS